jgi:flagellar assembly protein FliH
MTRPLRFEPFDGMPAPPVHAGPSADWLAGHAQGLAEAAASVEHRRAVAEEAALAALSDIAFTHAEARAALLSALVPFFRTLADRLLPEVAAAAFPLHLVEALSQAAAADASAVPDLQVSPADAALVAPLLAAANLTSVRLLPDPALAAGQARLVHGDGATALDAPALVAALGEVIAAWLDAAEPSHPEKEQAHG